MLNLVDVLSDKEKVDLWVNALITTAKCVDLWVDVLIKIPIYTHIRPVAANVQTIYDCMIP